VSPITRLTFEGLVEWSLRPEIHDEQPLSARHCAVAGGRGVRPVDAAASLAVGQVLLPAQARASKNAIYECGLESVGDAWIQFKPGYYLYGIIFLVFDVEAVFLLPFAVAFSRFGAAESLAMLVFLFLLVEGLVWAYQKNILVWT